MNHCRQNTHYRPAELILFERLDPGLPGGSVIILVIPARRREKLGHNKFFVHAFSIIGDSHFIGV